MSHKNLPDSPFVLVSYRHEPDDPKHAPRVEALVHALLDGGIRVAFDQDYPQEGPPGQRWEQWMELAVENAAAVVMVWSPGYRRGWDRGGESLGVPWECGLIHRLSYLGRSKERFIAVLATNCQDDVIPPRYRLPYYPLESDHRRLLEHIGRLIKGGNVTFDRSLLVPIEALLIDLRNTDTDDAVLRAVCETLPSRPELKSRPQPTEWGDWSGRAARATVEQGWTVVRRLLGALNERVDPPTSKRRLQRTSLPLYLAQALADTGLLRHDAWSTLRDILRQHLSHDRNLRADLRTDTPDDPLSLTRRALISICKRAADPGITLTKVATQCRQLCTANCNVVPLKDWLDRYGLPAVATYGELPVLWLELTSVGEKGGLPWEVVRAWARQPHSRPQELRTQQVSIRGEEDLEGLLADAVSRIRLQNYSQLVVQVELELDAAQPGLLSVPALNGDLFDQVLVQTCWPRAAEGCECTEPVGRENVDQVRSAATPQRLRLLHRNPVLVATRSAHRPIDCPVVAAHQCRVLTVLHPGDDLSNLLDTMFGEDEAVPLPTLLERLGTLTGAARPFLLWTDRRHRPYDPDEDGAMPL